MAYIYQITNDINQKVYVGRTEFSIEKRFKDHCKDSMRPRCEKRPLYDAMKKYGIEHFHISLIEETDKPEEREEYWIKSYGCYKYGYNATMGGNGKRYLDYELVKRTYEQELNQQTVAKILGISSDSVHNILTAEKTPILSGPEVIRNEASKPVKMISIEGETLRVFPSLNEAARHMVEDQQTGCKITTIKQHISEVCKKKRKTASKFKWEFL